MSEQPERKLSIPPANSAGSLFARMMVVFSLPVIVAIAFTAARFQTSAAAREIHLAPQTTMPQFVHDAYPEAQTAYRFAAQADNHELLREFPCYCGCVYLGHENNLDCYIQEVTADGPVFDNHAANCGICVEITSDVMDLWAEGQDATTIYPYIVETYSQRGPSTEDPV